MAYDARTKVAGTAPDVRDCGLSDLDAGNEADAVEARGVCLDCGRDDSNLTEGVCNGCLTREAIVQRQICEGCE